MKFRKLIVSFWLLLAVAALGATTLYQPPPDEALASGKDLWGLAAMEQANGPSYEFFAPLLSPLRYVNAGFRHYPIAEAMAGGWQGY